MRLIIRLFGRSLFEVSTEIDDTDDPARDLSGGDLTVRAVDPGTPDLYLGFTNGR